MGLASTMADSSTSIGLVVGAGSVHGCERNLLGTALGNVGFLSCSLAGTSYGLERPGRETR